MTEWVEKTIGEIGHVVTGKTPPTSKPENYGGGIPFVTPTDMDGRRYVGVAGRTLTEVGLSTVWKAQIPKEAVLVSCIGSDMGKAAMAASTCVTNQQINSIVVGPECDPKFVYYNLSARKEEIQLAASGSAQPILNKSAFSRLRLILPPFETQREIASVLSCLDDKIELNRQMNETLEAMARAIFKDWFVDFGPARAKAEDHSPYLAPKLWDLFPDSLDDEDKPVGWSKEPVYAHAQWVNGAAYKNMHFTDAPGALPVIKIAELKAGVTKNTKFTSTVLDEKYRISDGELLFSWSGNPDTSIDTFVWTGGDAWLNQHIFAVRQNGRKSKPFLYSMLKWLKPAFAEIARNKQTTGLGHVTQQDLKRLTVCTGTSDIRAAFDELAGPVYPLIYSSLMENRRLAETRDFLLPKLISGEIRLREAEKAVEVVA